MGSPLKEKNMGSHGFFPCRMAEPHTLHTYPCPHTLRAWGQWVRSEWLGVGTGHQPKKVENGWSSLTPNLLDRHGHCTSGLSFLNVIQHVVAIWAFYCFLKASGDMGGIYCLYSERCSSSVPKLEISNCCFCEMIQQPRAQGSGVSKTKKTFFPQIKNPWL